MKRTKILTLSLALCLILSTFVSCDMVSKIFNKSDEPHLSFTSNGDGTCYVSGIGTYTDLDVVIPPTSPEGDTVISIGDMGFTSCTNITSVTIPDSVTSIGDYAFSNCDSLTSVTIPDSVTSIGNYAFSGCSSLTSVTIPDSVMSIGNGAFSGCSNLSYNEYDTAYYLGNEDNPYLALIKVKDTLISSCEINRATKFIDTEAFRDCTNLIGITIPNSVTSIGYAAFFFCNSLTNIAIPDSVTNIGDEAFEGCERLKNVYYTGSEEDWAAISIGSSNAFFQNADIIYNYVPEG